MMEGMWSKGNTLPLLVGVQTWTSTMEIGVVILQEDGGHLFQDPTIPLLQAYTQRMLHFTTETLGQPCTLLLYS